ncbi:MAG: VWA domain-containing protein [Magnetococcales bacterium]|nr:VWA domain-containing protein [Magnetococcales bacterium]MBF0438495.1 VWA domain-containing protein [Magnetococcales bacterium]
MLHFEWPWIFLVLPLPWVARRLLAPRPKQDEAALEIPFIADFQWSSFPSIAPERPLRWLWYTAILAWLLLVCATARPAWLGEPVDLPASGRDLMLAVDLSGSMQTKDFKINGNPIDRLTVAKQVAADFIRRRVGDRTGLILFGLNAYLQAPLTLDRETTARLLEEAEIGLAGKETAIGEAIGLAVKKIRESPKNSRALILLTDGANTAGVVSPLKAAQLAASEGIKIYAIGVGADEMMVRSLFGTQRIDPSADLDEKTLTAMADLTHGRYFRAKDTATLEEIYRLLDELEPVAREKQAHRPTTALFYWPLTLSLLLAGLVLARQKWGRGVS